MVLPVTIWLAGETGPGPLTGLTVSSMLVAQGQPPLVAGLVAPLSALADEVCREGGRFVAHILGPSHRRLAQHFAGELPAPAQDLDAQPSPHGPVLAGVPDRLACRTLSWREFGWSVLVEAQIDGVVAGPGGRALAWHRGSFVTLE